MPLKNMETAKNREEFQERRQCCYSCSQSGNLKSGGDSRWEGGRPF